ncbi:MAG: arabinan endo-1,5-alpha-L-arabinosidase [Pseudolysinimonas sp.]
MRWPRPALAAVGVAALALVMVLAGCTSPHAMSLSGDLRAHDPALVVGAEGEPWFVYSTGDPLVDGGELQIRRSDDGGATWRYAGSVWERDERPAWIGDTVRGVSNLWAPDLIEHDGLWYLYYAASTFGSNHSAIGLATSPTLDPADPAFAWTDRGPVLASETSDPYNAIDPGIVVDAAGTPWMAFGSFWDGVHLVQLAWPEGLRADTRSPVPIAGGRTGPNAIEAPTIVGHDEAYFLFVSIGSCCQGVDSTYEIAVGRSDDVGGPYLDRDGIPMLDGGGTVLLSTDGPRVGPGGESASGPYLGFHFYDATAGGEPRLAIEQLRWDGGWPVLAW